jgi:hypothetical protein
VVVNGGAAQRSIVTRIQVAFDQHVGLPANPADAFQLVRQSDDASVTLSANVDDIGAGTVVTLTFTGGAVDPSFANDPSLVDGRFNLSVSAADVTSANGLLDGDGNGTASGNFVLVGDPVTNKLFRLFGDADGNGTVNQTDFIAFRSAFNNGPSAIFDFDGDGNVSQSDFIQFRNRFNVPV